MSTIPGISSTDLRFPTSHMLDASDAVNTDPDCSGAHLRGWRDADGGLQEQSFASTIGHGNDVRRTR
ncbi:hypothetical protein AB0L35_31950 [Streptomyces sp. NPDC052309]|uniref:hypothetical protein n=1 Tax=Streptomyces sp. NPDC052309 TaxID=3155421 RepID=UPI00341BABAF